MMPRLKWHMLRRRRSDPPFLRANLAAGLAAGAALEVDLVATADDDFVCLHELTLDEETTGSGPVGQATRAEIMRLRQRGTDGAILDVPPLFLDEIVAAVNRQYRPSHGLVQLDIKETSSRYDDRLVGRLADTLGEAAPRFVAGGCDWDVIARLRGAIPGLLAGYDPLDLFEERPPRNAPECEALAQTALRISPDADIYYLEARLVLGALDTGVNLVERFTANGAEVDVWTIDANRPNLRADLDRLIAAGVHQITTNDPDELLSMLQETA